MTDYSYSDYGSAETDGYYAEDGSWVSNQQYYAGAGHDDAAGQYQWQQDNQGYQGYQGDPNNYYQDPNYYNDQSYQGEGNHHHQADQTYGYGDDSATSSAAYDYAANAEQAADGAYDYNYAQGSYGNDDAYNGNNAYGDGDLTTDNTGGAHDPYGGGDASSPGASPSSSQAASTAIVPMPALETAIAAVENARSSSAQEEQSGETAAVVVASGFGNAAAYATPRPDTPPPHWREKEMTKRVYDRVNRRRIGGILATAGMTQLRGEVKAFEERTSSDLEILKSKQTLPAKQAIDAARRSVVHQQHVSELLMRSVETQQHIASRFKVNQDVARQDLLKQLPVLSSVQERVHRLRTLYTKEAAKASEEAKKAAKHRASRYGLGPTNAPTHAKPVVAAKLRVREELKALAPMPVKEMYTHLKSPDVLEKMLVQRRTETMNAISSHGKKASPNNNAADGQEEDTAQGDHRRQQQLGEETDPYELNRLRNETRLSEFLKKKHRAEAIESGIDPETGCIPPQAPLNVRAVPVGASKIQLTWDPPIFDGGQPITDYAVYFQPCELEQIGKRTKRTYGKEERFLTTRWFRKEPVAHRGFTWTFRRAETTVARIYVRAINIVGEGTPSNVVPEVTQPYADNPTRPTNVVVDKVTTRSIYVRWKPPVDSGGSRIVKYHITFNYMTWRDIKGPLKGGIGGRIMTTAHLESTDVTSTRFKISGLDGDTEYTNLGIQAVNEAGRLSKRSTLIACLRTKPCTDLQTVQNEINRVRGLKHEYCDTDVLTRGEVIQRLRCSDFLKTLQTRFDELQLEGQELDPPSDDEEWLAGGKDDPVDQEGVDTGGSESSLVRNTSHSALISSASPKAWPRARVKLFLPETGRAGDEMLATAPSGWISHVVVPKNATPGDFFEVDVENRPMRRAIVIRLEHYKKKIEKLHREIHLLTESCEEWAGRKNFNAYKLHKLEQRLRAFAAEYDRINNHSGMHIDSVIMHGEGTAQRFKTEELREMLENEMHSIKLSVAELKQEMVAIEDAFHSAERKRKFLEECLNDRYAGQLATMRENKRKFRVKTILGHASHWFLGRAMNNWCLYVEIRREEKRKMTSIMFAMQQCKLRAAMNKWVRTLRELDKLENISEELWGKGSRALVRVSMLRRDLEGNLQLVLGKIRDQAQHMDKYMSLTEKQIKQEFSSVHYRRKKRIEANRLALESKKNDKMSAAEKLAAKAEAQRRLAARKLALANLSQGDVSKSNQKYGQAFEAYLRYLDYCRNGEPDNIDARGMGVAYGRMGEVFEVWGQENKALVCHLRAEGLGKEVEDIDMQAQALFHIGNIYFQQLKYPDAVTKLGQAYDFFVELQNDEWKAKTLRALAKPYAAMFDEIKAASLVAAAEKIENVLRDQVDEIREKLTNMANTINDTAPVHCTVVDIERSTSTYPRLRQSRQDLLWAIEDVDRRLPGLEQRKEDAEQLVKDLKKLKKDSKAAPWADMHADLGYGQVETFKAKDFGWKVAKALEDAKKKRKEARDEVERFTTRRRNWVDEVQELERDISVENGVLMKKVMAEKRMRCVALNTANVSRNDVIGFALGGVEKLAMAIENNVVVVDIFDGDTSMYFVGDEEGSHGNEMHGHTRQVTCLQFYGDCVYSGSVDKTVRIWNINTRSCIATLKGHYATVWSIAVDHEKIITGAADNDMRIWDPETFECLKTIHGHKRTVRHIFLDGTLFSTTSTDETVSLWRVISKGERKFRRVDRVCKLRGHSCTVNVAKFRASDLVSGGADGRILTWDLRTEKILRDIPAHEGSVRDLQFDSTRIISAGADSRVLIHDYATGDRLHVLRGHSDAVLALQFDTRRMITVSADATIRHWHFRRPTTDEVMLKKYHAFEEGETLAQVARRYNMSLHKLCDDNGIDESAGGQDVFPGKHLLVRTIKNDYEEPKILQKAGDKYTTGLVKRIRLEVKKATDEKERQNTNAVGQDRRADSTLLERRKERVRLQLMDRKAQREILMEERRRRQILEEKGPEWKESSSEEEEEFTGEV